MTPVNERLTELESRIQQLAIGLMSAAAPIQQFTTETTLRIEELHSDLQELRGEVAELVSSEKDDTFDLESWVRTVNRIDADDYRCTSELDVLLSRSQARASRIASVQNGHAHAKRTAEVAAQIRAQALAVR